MIELKVNGKTFSGWKTASIKRAINSFASSFDLTVSQQFKNGIVDIPLDALCQILVDGIPVINGCVDEIKPSYSASSHDITFSGRSKTADLVDCSAIIDTGQIMNDELSSIIRKILSPFGIMLVFNPMGFFQIADFQLQQGETASAAIERLCSVHSLIYYDDPNGNLVISRASLGLPVGTLIHKIVDGSKNNILSGGGSYSSRDRFREYIVKSQMSGSDFTGGDDLSTEGRALDPEIPRYRPIVLLAESSMDNSMAESRAAWERSTRAGKSKSFDYVVHGWKNGVGGLWTPGSYVAIDDDFVQIKGKLVISDVSFNISADGGATSSLHLAPPEAFIPSTAQQLIKTFQGWKEFEEGV